ncbi:MAG TPA: GNAT family N-acetyltransferase [Terriglobales bacterium]
MSTMTTDETELNAKGITIRRFATADEMQVCVGLQQAVWGFSDVEIVPHRMFVVALRAGGQVLGAFDGERAIGFLLGFTAQRDGEPYIHSHMAAVLPEYQNKGIGRELKLAQREDALNRGIDLIEWTFDPLQTRNAHFNIARLGAIVREYLPNVYGCTSSPLHHGLPTDRLVAQWWICEPRVQQIIGGEPAEGNAGAKEVCVPRDILDICENEPDKAKDLQSRVRNQFQQLFREGFAVTGFTIDDQNGKYLLRRI